MIDDYKHQGLRKHLVNELRSKGISNENVLAAIGRVPRHLFVGDSAFLKFAYQDTAFQIGENQTISHPYTVAYQSSLLNIQTTDKVLEIGTGSGYQTAVLLELGATVISIERYKALHEKAKLLLHQLGYAGKKLKIFHGDGYKGKRLYAPFDKIIVTAGAPYVPEDLLLQLKIGGVLVIPVGEGKTQIMYKYTRESESDYSRLTLDEFSFVPLLEKTQ